jgi:spermidine synthase
LRAIALVLTVLTGFTGLVYEVAWQKVLATLLGSHSEAAAAVLALFLGGLAAGYAAFGALTRRLSRNPERAPPLLVLYGAVEIAIGLYAFLFPALFRGVQALSFAIPSGGEGSAFALDVALSALLIGPPSVLMGATIPVLTQALSRSLADATRFHAVVYACNTAGAFAGALAAGFWLVPALGLVGVLRVMGLINLCAGAAFAGLGWRGRNASRASTPAAASAPCQGFARWAFVSLLVGFAMMSVQTVLIRLGGLALGPSQFTFSMVVAVFVLCIALGSFGVAALPRVPRWLLTADLWALVLLLGALHLGLDATPHRAHVLRSLFASQPEGFLPFYGAAFVAALVVLAPAILLSGAALPLLFHALRREVGDLGHVAGRLYGWNTLGSLLGALLGGYALLFWLDLDQVFALAVVAVAVAAATASEAPRRFGRLGAPAVAVAASLAVVAVLPPWSAERLSSGLFRERSAIPGTFDGADALLAARTPRRQVVFYRDDPIASVAVHEFRDGGSVDRGIVTNGKPDSLVRGEYPTTGLIGILPALLAEKAERSFVVGYGTGVTAAELARVEGMREVVVAEISPGVVEAAPLFDFGNGDASRDERIRIVRADAYRALQRAQGRFDVIASEPSNPWVTGVEMLFSREFLLAARDRLNPGGAYGQWFHLYGTDSETVAMVMRTFASVFDHVSVWYTMTADVLLVGVTDPESALDVERIARRAARPDFAAALRRCRIAGVPELLAHELLPLGVLAATDLEGPLHTLLHPRLSDVAARAYFTGGDGVLPSTAALEPARVGRRNSLLRRYAARPGGFDEGERARVVAQVCQELPDACVTLLAHWEFESPDSLERGRVVADILGDAARANRTPLDRLAVLADLYGAGPPAADAAEALAVARRSTEQFVAWYHHAAPFSRSALDARWRRCEEDPAVRPHCLANRAVAEQLLGDFRAGERPTNAAKVPNRPAIRPVPAVVPAADTADGRVAGTRVRGRAGRMVPGE